MSASDLLKSKKQSTTGNGGALSLLQPKKEVEQNETSVFGDMLEQIPAGISRAFVELSDTFGSMAESIGNALGVDDVLTDTDFLSAFLATPGVSPEQTRNIAENIDQYIAKPETTAGGLVGGVSQFAAGYAMSPIKLKNKWVESAVRGAVADFTFFDPYEKRISNVIQDTPLANPVTEYLAADITDNEFEARMKQVGEGFVAGTILEGVVKGVKWLRGIKDAKKKVTADILFRKPDVDAAKKTIQQDAHDRVAGKILKESADPGMVKSSASLVDSDAAIRAKMTRPVIRAEVSKDVLNGIDLARLGKTDASQQLFKQVDEYLRAGELDATMIPQVLKEYNISPRVFADHLTKTYSEAGRTLNQLSQLRKQMARSFPEEKEATGILDEFMKGMEKSPMDYLDSLWMRLEGVRRSWLVTQIGTAVRNAENAFIKMPLEQFEKGVENIYNATLGRPLSKALRAGAKTDFAKKMFPDMAKEIDDNAVELTATFASDMRAQINAANAMYSRFTPAGRKQFDTIINQNHAKLEKMRLYNSHVAESHLGRFSKMLNVFNTFQDRIFKEYGFEVKMREILRKHGKDWSTIDPSKIPEKWYAEAVAYAQEFTWTHGPRTQVGREFIQAWSRFGGTTINPFPRFAFANALDYTWKHSPLGVMRVLNPTLYKRLLRGEVSAVSEPLAEATLGTLFLMSAWEFRNSDLAGENWYEIKNPNNKDEVIDIRAFAPFSAYFFFAEAVRDTMRPPLYRKLDALDYAENLVGLNRIQGTGLALFDILKMDSFENVIKTVQTFAGQYLGSFSVPARTFKDLVGGLIDTEENILRDVKEDPLFAPFLANIPFLSQDLPAMRIPYKEGDIATEHPLLRQFGGLSIRGKNEIEKEVDRLGLDKGIFYARTGDPKINRLINGYTGYYMENILTKIIETPQYKQLPDSLKIVTVKKAITRLKRGGIGIFIANHPDLFPDFMEGKIDDDTMRILIDMGYTSFKEILKQ